ncbi:MAG: VWA domain-containing protein [Gammaproteobacteria bacterium]|nr:VWA domain-containing protein [Gammaproteobacteria bacterium]
MTEFTPFQFLYPGWLLLLPPVWWLLHIYSRQTHRLSMWRKICDPQLLDNMIIKPPDWNGNQLILWILFIVLTLAILAAAGPSWRKQAYPMMESSRARVVALDLSNSMLVEDVRPNRHEHAKAAAKELISTDFDGETGLVVFAGAAFVVSPLSRDANTLSVFLDALDPSTMPEDGVRIDLAIDAAQDLLEAAFTGTGQILVVTAGATDNTTAVQAAISAADKGHQVSILAIGSAQGGPQPDSEGRLIRDQNGKFIRSQTNFDLLQRIASLGKGSMVAMKEYTGYGELLLSKLGASQLIESEQNSDSSERAAANDGAWLVWLLLPFALILFRRNLIWMILIGVLIPGEGEFYAKERGSLWEHRERTAYEAYQQGDYQTSYELSRNLQLRASAYYRSGLFNQALELFGEQESASSAYNRGNALAQMSRFPESILAFKKALELNPGLEQAKYNKRLVELYLEQKSESGEQGSEYSDNSDPSADNQNQSNTETRIGIAGEESTNPADNLQLGPGLGVSMQSGQADPFERFDGQEQEMERFVLRAQGDQQALDPLFIEQWINTLPETSTDLFRRKFLRDLKRRKSRQR